MEKTMVPSSGVARAKYVRDLTRKINQSEKFANVFATNRALGKARKLLDSKTAAAAKKKRKVEPKPSVKLQKRDINQEYIVQRMKFLKQSIEIVNQAVNNTASRKAADQPPPQIRFASKFEMFKNKSFEIEKRKLNELYRADSRNVNKTVEPVEEARSISSILWPPPDEPEPAKDILIPPCAPIHALISNPLSEVGLQEAESNNLDRTSLPGDLRKEPENVQIEQQDLSKSTVKAPDANTDQTLQLCRNQLQNINLDSNNSKAIVSSNNVASTRRICYRNKRLKRYTVKPFCAHCHDLITEVAYFSGTQQLCFECADRHYERVTRARHRDRPVEYKEFKNIGGDTIYNKSLG